MTTIIEKKISMSFVQVDQELPKARSNTADVSHALAYKLIATNFSF